MMKVEAVANNIQMFSHILYYNVLEFTQKIFISFLKYNLWEQVSISVRIQFFDFIEICRLFSTILIIQN